MKAKLGCHLYRHLSEMASSDGVWPIYQGMRGFNRDRLEKLCSLGLAEPVEVKVETLADGVSVDIRLVKSYRLTEDGWGRLR